MRKFFIGIITTLGFLGIATYAYLSLGYLDTRGDVRASKFETNLAMKFLDASLDRHAPERQNPIAPTASDLSEGMNVYQANCAVCHGDPSLPTSSLADSFHPPAPQFLEDPPDMPENQNFFVIQHGVRWTGMPGWDRTLTQQQMWQVTMFLAHLDKLPPDVKREWRELSLKKSGALPAKTSKSGEKEALQHD